MSVSASDRRKLGVTFFKTLRATRRLVRRDPDFDPSSLEDVAQAVLEETMGKPLAKAKAENPQINWDALIALIIKWLPIILGLFGIVI